MTTSTTDPRDLGPKDNRERLRNALWDAWDRIADLEAQQPTTTTQPAA